MVLLAQINLNDLPEQQELFPVNEGILQFWISSEDQMYGMSENLKGNNINSRLVYIKRANFKFITRKYSSAFEVIKC